MRRKLNLLATTFLALGMIGSAVAQEARDYVWRSDIYNHNWKIGTPKSDFMGRPQRMVVNSNKWVTIRVNWVAQLDNLDAGDALGADRADFFAMVWVDGQVYRSKVFSHDEGNPNWVLRVPVADNTSNIRIRLYDDDGGLEKRDDHVDINPAGSAKDLILNYDSSSGQITGDLSATKGTWIVSKGGGDDDRGRISFMIE